MKFSLSSLNSTSSTLLLRNLFFPILGGGLGGALGAFGTRLLADSVGTPLEMKPSITYSLIVFGLLQGLVIGYIILKNLGKNSRLYRFVVWPLYAAIWGGCLGSIYGGIICSSFSGGFFLGSLYSGSISFFVILKKIPLEKQLVSNAIFCIAGMFGGLIAGFVSGLIWGISGWGAHAEGYVLLVTALFMLHGCLIGIGITLGIICRVSAHGQIFHLGSISLILLFITWTHFDANKRISDSVSSVKHSRFVCNRTDFENNDVYNKYNKIYIINSLNRKKNKNIVDFLALYELSKNKKYALEVKKILLYELEINKFTNPANSIKSIQFDAAKRAFCYHKIRDIETLFSEDEDKRIITWFKNIADRIFTLEWVDYLYAIAFSRVPTGPYENQEIGVGALSILAEILSDQYPNEAQKCREYIDRYAVGWGGNFRNTDDSINYQAWWIYSTYLVAQFRPQHSWLSSENARKSFEWLLLQSPPNGMKLGYNDCNPKHTTDVMSLGAYLFRDGRYKWLAMKGLAESERIGDEWVSPLNIGIMKWDDGVESERPQVGSCYLEGPGNLPHDPGASMPDKIVFRDGWNHDSLYALLNLRYSGWHKYKATNCFVNVVYGKPFVVEDHIAKKHAWLPAGRSYYRDKKIDRVRLNGLQVGLEGYELLIHELIGMGSPWAQDPPPYARLAYFDDDDIATISKTSVDNWRGWQTERISILIKGKFLAICDRAMRSKVGNVSLIWHLKGKIKKRSNSFRLHQDGYCMDVYFPYGTDSYDFEIKDSYENDSPSDDTHAPDFDVMILSKNIKKSGFMTVFVPVKKNEHEIIPIDVHHEKGSSAYPDAMGCIYKTNSNIKYYLGIVFKKGMYRYKDIITDANFFIREEKPKSTRFNIREASLIKIKSLKKPKIIYIDKENKNIHLSWKYENKTIVIKNIGSQKYIEIEY